MMKSRVILNFSHFILWLWPEILNLGSKVENFMILIQCPHCLDEEMETQTHGIPCQDYSVACGAPGSPIFSFHKNSIK